MSNKDGDTFLKELDKFQFLFHNAQTPAPGSVKVKSPPIPSSLDALLAILKDAKQQLDSGVSPNTLGAQISNAIDGRKKDIDERLKEVYNSLGRIGKTLDKVSVMAIFTLILTSCNTWNVPEISRSFAKISSFVYFPSSFCSPGPCDCSAFCPFWRIQCRGHLHTRTNISS